MNRLKARKRTSGSKLVGTTTFSFRSYSLEYAFALRFSFEEDHFYVDLVFYNRLLRCYVLIDLKLGKLTHQDLWQMQMYVNYFDRYVKTDDENPTIGIVLCKYKKDALVELTLPEDANIFASQYQLYLPSKDELRRQIQEAVQEVSQ